MKRIFLMCLLSLCFGLQAQIQRGLKDDYNTENYPEITFVWNSANPEVLEHSQFVLMENDQNVDFKFTALPKSNIEQKQKSILFLWEDMASHRGQLDFSRNLMFRFFNETTLLGTDKFNVAVFNRQKDSERNVLQTLLPNFIDDDYKLSNAVRNYKGSKEYFREFPLQSDLYMAINSGIDLLKKQPSDRIGIIVVITAGLNIKAVGASTEMETVRKNATDAGIPVYVIKYPIFDETTEINFLATSTYGFTAASEKAEPALSELQRFYKNFNSRCYGQDYEITFTTAAKRDGKPHAIRLAIDKVPQRIPPFVAPDMTLDVWIKENLYLFAGLVIAVIGIVALVIILWLKNKKEKEAALRRNLENMRREADVKAGSARQEAEKNRQEQLVYQRKQEREKYGVEAKAEAERLFHLMQTKNLFPRLQCKIGNDSFTYNINKLVTTLGREGDNDVVLNNLKTSRYHAEIVFTGGGFEIIDKGSTNKIIVNGQLCERAILKNGDIIGLGEAEISFYI